MTFLEDVQRRVANVQPYYDPPMGNYRRLDQNVNLYGPHPRVAKLAQAKDVHLYPGRDNADLEEALAKRAGVPKQQVWVGNGSDDTLDHLMRILLSPGQRLVSAPGPTYAMYPHLARLNRLQYATVDAEPGMTPTVDAILKAKADGLLLCRPNNPTGTNIRLADVERVLQRFPGPVIVDEAYAEFSPDDTLGLLAKNPNLIISRTLSKAFGLAGLRIGYGIAHPDVAKLIRSEKPPFSVGIVSERLALEAIADPEPVAQRIRLITAERQRLTKGLTQRGFTVIPSQANFLLTQPPMPVEALLAALKDRMILARRYSDPLIQDRVRFTVGKPEDTDALLAALDQILPKRRVKK